jgi:hypothetical protein
MKVVIKSIIIMGLLCSSAFAQGMEKEKTTVEKHKEFLAQQKEPSTFMRWVNKFAGPYVFGDYPSKPAKPCHEQLWKKAQNDLNIPAQYHAHIVAFDSKKVDLAKDESNELGVVGAMIDKMYVNEDVDNLIGYGISRFTYYHEGAHHKYLDPFNRLKRKLYFKISDLVLTLSSALGLSLCSLYIGTKIKNSKISLLLYNFPVTAFLTSALITLPSAFLLNKYSIGPVIDPLIRNNLEKYAKFCERRADLEAAYALKCDQCVQDRANDIKSCSPKDQELTTKNGYVSWEELEEIAQEHKRNGLMCDYHKKETDACLEYIALYNNLKNNN